jgi:co-chaperonin GroES (HSP10)
MSNYVPLSTKVLLKKLPKQEVKLGSIITIEEPKEKLIAEVVSYGSECKNSQLPCVIRYAPYSAHVIDEDNPDYLIVDEKDIWCIVRENG